ncbi:MAG: xanthine dehydrogenase family protein molybdopterin-binding subunit [Pseudolabrys sp.]
MTDTPPQYRGRREDRRLVTGQGRYTNDWNFDNQAHAWFRRADRAHAVIKRVDTSAAARSPGVLAVLSGRDVADQPFATVPPIEPPPGRGGQKVKVPERPVLARERVRFVGEEVAVVVAETAAQARDAAELIDVEYEDLPVLIGPERALAPDASAIHDNVPGNVCFDFEYGDEAATDAAFARADGVVGVSVESPRVAPNPMEVRGAVVVYDASADSYDIYSPNQGGPAFRDELAVMAGVPVERLRVRMVDIGGAFGARTNPFPEYPALMLLARTLRRPVKWLSTRSDDFLTDNHGRAISLRGELAYSKEGKFIALRTEWLCDSGAYLAAAGVLTNSINGKAIGAGAYRVEALYGRHRQITTNPAPTNAYRGAGRPEANLIVERLVDEAAARLGVDPLQLRARNLIKKSQMPYRTLTGIAFDSGDFPGLLAAAKEHSDWKGFKARRRLPELVSRWLGVPAERITSHAGDPDGPALHGNPSIGSRSGMSQGSAFKVASDVVIEKARRLAADALEANPDDLEFADGVFTIAGTDRAVRMTEIIERHDADTPHPLDTFAGRDATRAFPSGAHVVEVEIDRDTGAVQVVRYTAVDDIGNAINRTIADGQFHGGIMQGAGQVFGEHCRYDDGDGQLLTGSFMDYCMPHADLLPPLTLVDHGVPTPSNPLGAKGVGEAGTTGALPACLNAVMDALRSAGVTHFDMPATPARIWSAIAAARNGNEEGRDQ